MDIADACLTILADRGLPDDAEQRRVAREKIAGAIEASRGNPARLRRRIAVK